ncbi:hypothetical protein LDO31_03665 [Luteimonas sp. XNQY3]|nr:hypothetical protein [Luteimonas sp. XNQY3]MCD9005345.1 hypothetical protein [Luteimonas sp. XNQY3]
MSPDRWLVIVLVVGAALAVLRLVVGHLRAMPDARPAVWRTCVLAALTLASTVLLYRGLLPPPVAVERGTLAVLTAGAGGLALPAAEVVVALPESGNVPPGAERMPDLATALRRHPDARALIVVGHGLEVRDRDAVDGRALAFVPAEAPAGLAELVAPDHTGAGARFEVRGRLGRIDAARVSLMDPAGRIVSTAQADETGRFRLDATARDAGVTLFEVVAQDADAREIERVQVPVIVDAAAPVRVLLIAGSPNPDMRALRRWAEDAGLSLRWRTAFGGGAGVGDAPAFDAASLARQDLVLLDARAWDGLGAGARASLLTAVRGGLGVLVHAPQAPSAALRGWLRSAGLTIETGRAVDWQPEAGSDDVARLRAWMGPGSDDAPFDPLLAGEAAPTLAYLPLSGGVPAHGDAPVDMMRGQAVGQGRIGVVTLADSWQLPLAGRADLHAGLWSGWAGTLARAGDVRPPRFAGELRMGMRSMVCGLDADARIHAPDGTTSAPVPDPAANGCAGIWPGVAGWHRLEDASGSWPFLVRAEDAASGLHIASLQTATRVLVRASDTRPDTMAATRPGRAWPWLLAWLCVTAALWALGRARVGRTQVPTASRSA